MISFEQMGINAALIKKLAEKNIIEPVKVQLAVMPTILLGKSIVFQSETGTGKTFAYLLPLLTRLANNTEQLQKQPRLVIAAPTHELASQIKSQADFLVSGEDLCADHKIRAALFIGGAPLKRQMEKLKEKPDIATGGPARLLELINLKKLKTDAITTLVLDEADRLFSPELRDYTTALIEAMPKSVQIIACSATIKLRLLELLPAGCEFVKLPPEDILTRKISHWAFHAEKRDKIDSLRALLTVTKHGRALVFCAETGQIANITERLTYKNIQCASLHAKTDKMERKKAIDNFRAGKCSVLITSDLAARGLDIPDITHIIQMDIPENEDFFVHRAGRTARAGKEGVNILIGDEWELRLLSKLEKKLGIVIYPKVLYGGKILAADQQQNEKQEKNTATNRN